MTAHPKPTHYTITEGGDWWPWRPALCQNGVVVNAIKFEDGSVFDVVNGWRPGHCTSKPMTHHQVRWIPWAACGLRQAAIDEAEGGPVIGIRMVWRGDEVLLLESLLDDETA